MANKPTQVKRSWVVERKPFERDNSNADFYNSWAWRKLRKLQLDKNPLCKHCEDNDVITKAKVADHIISINRGGERLDEANLQSLCESCHNKKSANESRS
jgi:5-methylcytosine-specific restriction protein A